MMNSFNIIQRYSLVHCSESLIEHKFHSVISFLMLTSAIICSFPYFHGLRKCKKYFDLYRVFCVCESALMFVRVEESCSIVSSVYNWTLIIIIAESPVINTVLNLFCQHHQECKLRGSYRCVTLNLYLSSLLTCFTNSKSSLYT